MGRDKKEGGSKEIQYDDVREANKKKSEYGTVVTPYYREQAASTIKSAFKRYRAVKAAKKEFEEAGDNVPLRKDSRQHYWAARSQHIKRMSRLKEPRDITENDAFNTKLVQAIKDNKYHLIDYTDKDFTPRLFAALRLGLITMNQLLSVKLMYESLMCFNNGKMPERPSEQFSRFKVSDTSSPYQPSQAISHWGYEETEQLQDELQKPGADEAQHYYTIDLPRHQAVGFFYYNFERGTDDSHFIDMFSAYLERLPLLLGDKIRARKALEAYKKNPNQENKDILQNFILVQEPKLKNFLTGTYDSSNPKNEQNLGLTYAEYNREWSSIRFLTNLYYAHPEMPSVCTPKVVQPGVEQPLLSFVLPTIDTLNMLQKIAHGEEATLPAAVLGQETPRMIRAYDELPASKKKGRTLTPAEVLLQSLYPTAGTLEGPSRPIELTYPGVAKTEKPHGADCHDFLLSWHDMFHAWRNGSNYKELIRHFRKLHDDKLGFFEGVDAMSKNIWTLTDIDFSGGRVLRSELGNRNLNVAVFFSILESAGFNITKPIDDNYLFLYSLCQSPDNWGEPFGIDPKDLAKTNVPSLIPRIKDKLSVLNNQVNDMKSYLKENPDASVVEVIVHDLLNPDDRDDLNLVKALRKEFKNIFYWSRNTGLFFKEEFRADLKKLGVDPNLRTNSPELIRSALQFIAIKKGLIDDKTLINMKVDQYDWPVEMVRGIFRLQRVVSQQGFVAKIAQAFEVDKDTHSVVLKSTPKPINTITASELLSIYFEQLGDDELNDALKNADSPSLIRNLDDKNLIRLNDINLSLFVREDSRSLELLKFFPPGKNQNFGLSQILGPSMTGTQQYEYLKKYFDLNSEKSQLTDQQKEFISTLKIDVKILDKKNLNIVDKEIINNLDTKNLNILADGDQHSLDLLNVFPPEKNQNDAFFHMLGSSMTVAKQFKYIEKYFELNPGKSKSLNPQQKEYICELEKQLISGIDLGLGDGRKGDKTAVKTVTIKTKEEMAEVIASIHEIQDIKSNQTDDLQFKYQLLSTQYQALFNKIISEAGLYTRKSTLNPFNSNDQTKSLTDTQLMHIGFLKSLFINEVKNLIQGSQSDKELRTYIENDVQKKEGKDHFINFNRTRYNLFVKETTSSKEELQKELQAGFKSELSALRKDSGEAPQLDPSSSSTIP